LLTIIRNAEVYAPEHLGRKDILIVGDRIGCIEDAMGPIALPGAEVEVVDAEGRLAFPGLIDGHVHLAGGGGEGGFRTRTPEIVLGGLVLGGVTTVIGCLGTDCVTRSLESLYAKTKALEEEGITAYMFTGAYRIPIPTLTGSPMRDMVLIDKVIGAGEVAISDHRSSQPSLEELKRLAADVRVGGILSGKAGVLNIHLGDGPAGLGLLRELVATTEIPYSQFLPTHINRSGRLLEEGIAYALGGGCIDLTCSDPEYREEGDITASAGLRRCLAAGVPVERVTFTSDGQGSLPIFNAQRECVQLGVGRVSALFSEVREAVLKEGIPLEQALRVVTLNPAERFRLKGKGRLETGCDADLVLVDRDSLALETVIARGRTLMKDGQLLARGTFESA
jgi:beta-aspartyl-dipeptidase (metallo-type)